MNYIIITLGSGIGGLTRYICTALLNDRLGLAPYWSTALVNIIGSCAIGYLAVALEGVAGKALNQDLSHFLIVGFCGGYTTFSAFSLQTIGLIKEGNITVALSNVVLSVILCLLSVWAGMTIANFKL